jgi:hypothetical protein
MAGIATPAFRNANDLATGPPKTPPEHVSHPPGLRHPLAAEAVVIPLTHYKTSEQQEHHDVLVVVVACGRVEVAVLQTSLTDGHPACPKEQALTRHYLSLR